mmetsp:Transcript_12784/g.46771  ORF Transcript_12784/g.46771 Transcript_12784/m.46771 type:complete len:325 (-) Transcript_12784:1481-2455(-)
MQGLPRRGEGYGQATPEEDGFDWVKSPQELQEFLEPELLQVDQFARVLNVGCGTSDLSYFLAQKGWQNILSVDCSADCIAAMQAKYAALAPQLAWRTVDMARCAAELPVDHSFGLIVDKGTLDCMLCAGVDDVVRMFIHVHRLLEVGGVYLVVSYHPRDYLMPLMQSTLAEHGAFDLSPYPLHLGGPEGAPSDRQGSDTGSVILMKKLADDPEPTLEHFLEQARRWFDTTVALTVLPAEALRVRTDFAKLCPRCQGQDAMVEECNHPLDLPVAYRLLIADPLLRSEYTESEFADDVAAFCANGKAASTRSLTAEEGLRFLRECG